MNILITGAWQCNEDDLTALNRMGHNIVFMKQEKDEIPCEATWVEAVICNNLFNYHVISIFNNLRYVQTTSAGLDRIPMDYCTKHNIVVNNARNVYSIPMAEFAVSSVLDLLKRKMDFWENQKQHLWKKIRDIEELNNKIVLIVGCGNVGYECAKRFSAFNCTVLGVDLNDEKKEYFDKVVPIIDIYNVLPQSDIIILTLPLTNSTYHLFNKKLFAIMKKNSIIVNLARGEIINTDDLIDSLNKHLYAAILDVCEDEPLETDSRLWDMKNVLITPHNSYVGNSNSLRLRERIISNLNEYMKGKNYG